MSPPSNIPERALLEELAKRAEQKRATAQLQDALLAELFPEQRAFVTDKHRRKAVLGSRRAGKTEMWSRYAVMVALQYPRTLTRLWSHARLRAKDLLWNPLKYLLQRNGIPYDANETELSITLKNGSVIRLVGANQDKEAQKKRGEKTKLEVVLETQNFPGFLQSLVDDVIEPSLMDEMGTVCMEGTPGALCAGYWFEVTGQTAPEGVWDSDTAKAGKWRVHRWTMLQNPYLPHARQYLTELKASKRWADDNPTYLREYCGRWVNDLGSLFYSFDATRNTYDVHKVIPYGPGWSHALGWDLGFRDDMAIAIIGWNPQVDGNVYEVFSWKKPEVKDAAQVMRVIEDTEKRFKLNLIEQVADTGGGGRMYVEEVMTRFGRAFKPAKKAEKYEHVRLLNDDFITGKLKLIPGSVWAEEIAALQRDPDWPDPDKPEAPPREDPRCANHVCFVAGTSVVTSNGDVPIEFVRPGMLVATRRGWRPVVQAGPTGIRPVVTAAGLTGTPEHPVWTQNRGWVRLQDLRTCDTVLTWTNHGKCNGADSHGIATLNPREEVIACTTSEPAPESRCGCTGRCTNTTTGPSQEDTTFTTLTETRSTIYRGTCRSSQAETTSSSTSPSTPSQAPGGGSEVSYWPETPQGRGTRLPLASHGTHPTVRRRGQVAPRSSTPARSVASNLNLEPRFRARAAWRVTRPGAGRQARTMSFASVRSVERSSPRTGSSPRSSALVFAMSVAGVHEYFANGVLVSNCDAGLYVHRAAYSHFSNIPVKAPKRNTDDWAVDIERQIVERYRRRDRYDWTTRMEEGVPYADDS